VKDEAREIRAELTQIATKFVIFEGFRPLGLALASLEAPVRLVDDVGAPATADHAAIAVARLERLQAVANLHGARLSLRLVL
jgi:hypothetical protein